MRTGFSLSTRTKHLRPLAHATTLVHSAVTDLFRGRIRHAMRRLSVAEMLLKKMLDGTTPTDTTPETT